MLSIYFFVLTSELEQHTPDFCLILEMIKNCFSARLSLLLQAVAGHDTSIQVISVVEAQVVVLLKGEEPGGASTYCKNVSRGLALDSFTSNHKLESAFRKVLDESCPTDALKRTTATKSCYWLAAGLYWSLQTIPILSKFRLVVIHAIQACTDPCQSGLCRSMQVDPNIS